MKRKIPSSDPTQGPGIHNQQRPQTNTDGDIWKKMNPERVNPNSGPQQRSRKKAF
jgi:hypothetical protein